TLGCSPHNRSLFETRPALLDVGNDFNQYRLAFRVEALSFLEGRSDLRGPRHFDANGPHAFGDLGIVTLHLRHSVLLPRLFADRAPRGTRICRHVAVVEQHRRDRGARSDGGLDIRARHAECAVAHDIEAELLRLRDLRADCERNAEAEMRSLAPAD